MEFEAQRGARANALRATAVTALLAAGLSLACGGDGDASRADGFPLNADPGVAYVGLDACRECHLGVVSTYSHTGMGRSFYPLTPDRVVEDFERDNELVVAASAVRYRMFERDGRYYQRQFLLVDGRETAVDEHELLWVVGSNNHNRSYLVSVEGRLFQAPVCWYPQVEKWELCPGYEHKNEHFARETSESCVYCHNGVMPRVEGTRNAYVEPIPHGIGCERCHGPGALHVERWSHALGEARGEPDPTIVNPRRLEAGARLDVCLQCHLGDARATERVPRRGRELTSYRPGRPLNDVIVPFRYASATEVDFGLSAQGDRLMLSRCFLESAGALDCLTCHNPHVSVYHEERPADLFRRKCLGCHVAEDCGAEHAARAATPGAEDDCVACHMRKAEPDDQRFTEFTDHWIRRDIRSSTHDARDSWSIEPVRSSDLEPFNAGERLYYRARAEYLLGEDAPPRERERMWNAAVDGHLAAIAAGFDNADVRFFLGKTRLHLGRTAEAQDDLRRAVAFEPAHRDARFALGQALGMSGDLRGASEIFLGMLGEASDDPMALAEYGRASWSQGRYEEAVDSYRRAIAAEPWNAALHLNLANTLASVGRLDAAMQSATEAARLDPDSIEIWEFLVHLNDAAGRGDAADRARDVLLRLGVEPPPPAQATGG